MPTTVFFASNRILTGDPTLVGSYSPNIQPPSDNSGIVYGTAIVDGVDVPGNQQGTITTIQDTSIGAFAANVADDLAAAGRNLLVFLHGFDNTFEDAICRAAFNREFLAASGKAGTDTTVLAFAWPSLGKLLGFPIPQNAYLSDQKMARASGLHLMRFFAQLEPILRRARATGCRSYLLAHSMGNLALESAVENWFLHGNGHAELFDVSILAAGDCGFDAFAQPHMTGLDGLSQLSRRISVYFSGEDEVLDVSRILNGQQRLGQDGAKDRGNAAEFPQAIYRTFDATLVDDYGRDFMRSHQYYRLSRTVRDAIASDMSG